MSDLRERLADALRAAGDKWMVAEPDDPDIDQDPPYYEYLVNELLSLPGIAIVELPEPSYVDEPEEGLKGYGFNGTPPDSHIAKEHGVYAHDGLVYDQYDGMTPAQSRTIASWWLAAANAAEAK